MDQIGRINLKSMMHFDFLQEPVLQSPRACLLADVAEVESKAESSVDIGRISLLVGKILSVGEHPISET
jgi:hypothetical protein